jgi:hypothetical protein
MSFGFRTSSQLSAEKNSEVLASDAEEWISNRRPRFGFAVLNDWQGGVTRATSTSVRSKALRSCRGAKLGESIGAFRTVALRFAANIAARRVSDSIASIHLPPARAKPTSPIPPPEKRETKVKTLRGRDSVLLRRKVMSFIFQAIGRLEELGSDPRSALGMSV